MAGSPFTPLLLLLSHFPLSLVCFSPPSPILLKDAPITIDKPQVYVYKAASNISLSPIFLCCFTWTFSSWGFSSGPCFAAWRQQIFFTRALGWSCWVGAVGSAGSKAQWFPARNLVGCEVAGAAGLTAPTPRISPPTMKVCKLNNSVRREWQTLHLRQDMLWRFSSVRGFFF